jgi:hypothetical protein
MTTDDKTNRDSNEFEKTDSDRKADVTDQIAKLSDTFQNIFSNINANFETSRFVIEKVDEGTKIDVEFKAVLKKSKNSREIARQ